MNRATKRSSACVPQLQNRIRNSCIVVFLISCSLSAQSPAPPASLEKAEQAFNAGQYSEALRLFQRAQSESPNCELYFYVGLTQYRLKRPDEAITGFAASAACDPQLFLAHRALGDAYLQKGDENRALAAYEAALKVQPQDAEILRNAAHLCLKHELNVRAIPLLERLVQLQPADPDAKADLGAVYGASGEMEKAEIQFRAALALNSQAPPAVLGLGALYLKTNRNEDAIPLLTKAAKLASGEAKPLYLLGSAYNRLGRYRDAVAALEQAASRSPGDPDIYYQLAHAYGHLRRAAEKQKALDRFTEIKARGEKLFESRREAARLAKEVEPVVARKDIASALQMMEKAHELDPTNEEVCFRLASLYYDTQEYELARDYVQRLVARAPSEWRYVYLLGLAQKATSHWNQAKESLERVVQLNPSMAEAYNELGNLAMKENQPARAAKAYQRALETNPQESTYREHLESAQKAAAQRH